MSALVGWAASALVAPETGLLLNVKSWPPLVEPGPCSTQLGIPTTVTESSRRSSNCSQQTCRTAETSARRERAREFLRSRVMNESSFARLARPDRIFRCTTLALRCGYRCPASCDHQTK